MKEKIRKWKVIKGNEMKVMARKKKVKKAKQGQEKEKARKGKQT